MMTDVSGDSTGTIKYYPYGSTRSGSVSTDKKFTGQRLDGTGLYYYNARYYDAGIGRFISADTVVPSPMNPQDFNRYSYALNNPLKYVDPSGHQAEDLNYYDSTLAWLWDLYQLGIWPFSDEPPLPIEPSRPVTPIEPEPSLPNPVEVITASGGIVAIGGASSGGVVYVIAGVLLVGYSVYWSIETGWLESTWETISSFFSSFFSSKQDKPLTEGEIKKLKKGGVDPHELKDYSRGKDLFKNERGDIIVKPKSGEGPGEPTGYNINDF
jgi:RHS repeat-associated protein